MVLQNRGSSQASESPLGSGLCPVPSLPMGLAKVLVLCGLLWRPAQSTFLEEGREGGRAGKGRSYLQPPEEGCDLPAHEAGVADGNGIVVVGQGDPVSQPHVHWLGQLRLQCGHHLPNPVFQQAIHLGGRPTGSQLHGRPGGGTTLTSSFSLCTFFPSSSS